MVVVLLHFLFFAAACRCERAWSGKRRGCLEQRRCKWRRAESVSERQRCAEPSKWLLCVF